LSKKDFEKGIEAYLGSTNEKSEDYLKGYYYAKLSTEIYELIRNTIMSLYDVEDEIDAYISSDMIQELITAHVINFGKFKKETENGETGESNEKSGGEDNADSKENS
jgi:hypothetical protein